MRHGCRSLPGSILMPVTARRGRCCVGKGVGSPQDSAAVGAGLTQPRKRKRQRRGASRFGPPTRTMCGPTTSSTTGRRVRASADADGGGRVQPGVFGDHGGPQVAIGGCDRHAGGSVRGMGSAGVLLPAGGPATGGGPPPLRNLSSPSLRQL